MRKGIEINDVIAQLGLLPHPEGGYYKETYRSSSTTINTMNNASRSLSTGIYFLLTADNFSALHKIQSDEMWHFYAGDTIEIVEIDAFGHLILTKLGNQFNEGEVPQYVVKAGHWFGSRVYAEGNAGLVGCTVSPGFDFADFEMGKQTDLINAYPQHRTLIASMTRI